MKRHKKINIKINSDPPTTKKLVFPGVFYITLIISITTLLISFLLKNSLPPQIPLFYGLAAGEEQVTSSTSLIIPAIVGFSLLLLNTGLSLLISNQFYKKILIVSSFAANLLIFITVAKIILLVGNF